MEKKIEKRERRKAYCKMEFETLFCPALAADITGTRLRGFKVEEGVNAEVFFLPIEGSRRVPVILIDHHSKVHYYGMRSLSRAQTVHLEGGAHRVDMRKLFVDGKGLYWIAVVDHTPGTVTAEYYAPYPLKSKADADRYFDMGITGDISATQLANMMRWNGFERLGIAARFKEAVLHIKKGGSVEFSLSTLPDVTFPDEEIVMRTKTWEEVSGEIAAMQSTVADMVKRFEMFETVTRQAREISARTEARLQELEKENERLRKGRDTTLAELSARVDDLILG